MNPLDQVPTDLAENVRRRWPERAAAWTDAVPDELHALAERYNAEVSHVYPARYGLVLAVMTPSGPLVFRSTADPAGPDQAKFARAYAALGIGPAVHEVITTDAATWTVAERITPGHSLTAEAEPGDFPNRMAELFRTMKDLPSPAPDAPHIAAWLDRRLAEPPADDLPPTEYEVTEQQRQHARAVLTELRQTERAELSHGDAHPDNVLTDQRGRPYWIDPRGMNAELAYDLAVLALKAAFDQRTDPAPLAADLAERTAIDADRVHAWLTIAHAARV